MSTDEQYARLRAASEAGSPALTIELGARYLARYPDDFRALMRYGMALQSIARYADAEAAYDHALALASAAGRAVVLRQRGLLAQDRGDYAEAERRFIEAVEAAPDEVASYVYLSGVLAQGGRLEDAERVLRRGVACRDGPVEEVHFNLGLVLRAQARYFDALECFRAALTLDPAYEAARTALDDVEQVLFGFPGDDQ